MTDAYGAPRYYLDEKTHSQVCSTRIRAALRDSIRVRRVARGDVGVVTYHVFELVQLVGPMCVRGRSFAAAPLNPADRPAQLQRWAALETQAREILGDALDTMLDVAAAILLLCEWDPIVNISGGGSDASEGTAGDDNDRNLRDASDLLGVASEELRESLTTITASPNVADNGDAADGSGLMRATPNQSRAIRDELVDELHCRLFEGVLRALNTKTCAAEMISATTRFIAVLDGSLGIDSYRSPPSRHGLAGLFEGMAEAVTNAAFVRSVIEHNVRFLHAEGLDPHGDALGLDPDDEFILTTVLDEVDADTSRASSGDAEVVSHADTAPNRIALAADALFGSNAKRMFSKLSDGHQESHFRLRGGDAEFDCVSIVRDNHLGMPREVVERVLCLVTQASQHSAMRALLSKDSEFSAATTRLSRDLSRLRTLYEALPSEAVNWIACGPEAAGVQRLWTRTVWPARCIRRALFESRYLGRLPRPPAIVEGKEHVFLSVEELAKCFEESCDARRTQAVVRGFLARRACLRLREAENLLIQAVELGEPEKVDAALSKIDAVCRQTSFRNVPRLRIMLLVERAKGLLELVSALNEAETDAARLLARVESDGFAVLEEFLNECVERGDAVAKAIEQGFSLATLDTVRASGATDCFQALGEYVKVQRHGIVERRAAAALEDPRLSSLQDVVRCADRYGVTSAQVDRCREMLRRHDADPAFVEKERLKVLMSRCKTNASAADKGSDAVPVPTDRPGEPAEAAMDKQELAVMQRQIERQPAMYGLERFPKIKSQEEFEAQSNTLSIRASRAVSRVRSRATSVVRRGLASMGDAGVLAVPMAPASGSSNANVEIAVQVLLSYSEHPIRTSLTRLSTSQLVDRAVATYNKHVLAYVSGATDDATRDEHGARVLEALLPYRAPSSSMSLGVEALSALAKLQVVATPGVLLSKSRGTRVRGQVVEAEIAAEERERARRDALVRARTQELRCETLCQLFKACTNHQPASQLRERAVELLAVAVGFAPVPDVLQPYALNWIMRELPAGAGSAANARRVSAVILQDLWARVRREAQRIKQQALPPPPGPTGVSAHEFARARVDWASRAGVLTRPAPQSLSTRSPLGKSLEKVLVAATLAAAAAAAREAQSDENADEHQMPAAPRERPPVDPFLATHTEARAEFDYEDADGDPLYLKIKKDERMYVSEVTEDRQWVKATTYDRSREGWVPLKYVVFGGTFNEARR